MQIILFINFSEKSLLWIWKPFYLFLIKSDRSLSVRSFQKWHVTQWHVIIIHNYFSYILQIGVLPISDIQQSLVIIEQKRLWINLWICVSVYKFTLKREVLLIPVVCRYPQIWSKNNSKRFFWKSIWIF